MCFCWIQTIATTVVKKLNGELAEGQLNVQELNEAIFTMKKMVAAGKSGIFPQLLLYGGWGVSLAPIARSMWSAARVVAYWKDTKYK